VTSIILNDEAQALPKELQELVQDCVDKTLEFEEFPFSAEVSFSIKQNDYVNYSPENNGHPAEIISYSILLVNNVLVSYSRIIQIQGSVYTA